MSQTAILKNSTSYWLLILFAGIFVLVGCQQSGQGSQEASLVVLNGKIWTGDQKQPWAEAMAVKGDSILLVSSTSEVRKLIGNATQVIEAKGKLITPGFIDTHVHFMDAGLSMGSVQLRDVRSKEEFIARISAFAKTVPAGAWITGGDWDHTNWGGELPESSWVDSVTKEHPVFLNRLDGHMALANTRAIQAANINATTKDVPGGTIVRRQDGAPAGVFKDNAMNSFYEVITDPPAQVKDRALAVAMEYVAEQGVTSVHSMGSWADLEVYQRANAKNKLQTRIYAVVPLDSWEKLRQVVEKEGRGGKYLQIGGLKGFVDGSLGSHTAAFLKPFTDAPADSGFFVTPPAELYQQVSGADKAGLQVMVHAIGDRANHEQLNIFERVTQENGPRDRRFRIEHAQHIAPQDFPRFHALQVIASMQPYHAIDDGRWADHVIGTERSKTSYPFRSLLDNKAQVAFGSDWNVAPPTPLEGIYGAVTRRTIDEKQPNGWVPEQKITVEEALRGYTTTAAFASFEENRKGTLTQGKLADFVMLDQDITAIEPEAIRMVKVVMTVVGGNIIYKRK